jgi:hypothetical protein
MVLLKVTSFLDGHKSDKRMTSNITPKNRCHMHAWLILLKIRVILICYKDKNQCYFKLSCSERILCPKLYSNDFKHTHTHTYIYIYIYMLHHLPLHTMIQVISGNLESLETVFKQTSETASDCIRTNYYGTKQMSKELVPILQLSNSARIINVSASLGQLKVQYYYIVW